MTDKNYGDKEFEDFMENDEGNDSSQGHECPKINEMVLIISTIREKMKFINSLFKESVGSYEKIKDGDPLKTDLKKYITDLMVQSVEAMNQLDYALIDTSDDDSKNGTQEELPL